MRLTFGELKLLIKEEFINEQTAKYRSVVFDKSGTLIDQASGQQIRGTERARMWKSDKLMRWFKQNDVELVSDPKTGLKNVKPYKFFDRVKERNYDAAGNEIKKQQSELPDWLE